MFRFVTARLLPAAALAAALAAPSIAAAGHCDSGSCRTDRYADRHDSGHHDRYSDSHNARYHDDCRYEWVTKFRVKTVVKYKHVVEYDRHGDPYVAEVPYRATVRVPYRVKVKVCH